MGHAQGHPQIYTPANKEPYFFADELHPPAATPRTFGWTPDTLEEYLTMFQPALPEQRTGEASAPYLWSRTAAQRIAEVQPAARIIAILREPASFLYSLHLQFVQIYIEPETDMRRALALEEARREGKHLPEHAFWGPQGTLYSDYVRYVEQLRRYQALFGAEQMLVLVYDDYRKRQPGHRAQGAALPGGRRHPPDQRQRVQPHRACALTAPALARARRRLRRRPRAARRAGRRQDARAAR